MSREYNLPIYRKIEAKNIFIKVCKDTRLVSVCLNFGEEGHHLFDDKVYLSDIPSVIKDHLYNAIGEYQICSKKEFQNAIFTKGVLDES